MKDGGDSGKAIRNAATEWPAIGSQPPGRHGDPGTPAPATAP